MIECYGTRGVDMLPFETEVTDFLKRRGVIDPVVVRYEKSNTPEPCTKIIYTSQGGREEELILFDEHAGSKVEVRGQQFTPSNTSKKVFFAVMQRMK